MHAACWCTLFASVLHAASSASFGSAARQAQGRSAALKALSGIASIGSIVSQRNWTQAALANMPLLTTLLTAALASAETPKYCGRAGSGVDELRAPQTEASLRSVQVVARHGARAPVADCGRWLPAAAGATWPCPGEAVEGVSSGSLYRLRSGVADECGPGELLKEGFAQHRALGRALREAYWAPGPLVSSRPII